MYRGPLSIRTPEQLAEKGFPAYASALGMSTHDALEQAFANGLIPSTMHQSLPMIARLLDECDAMNHLDAAGYLEMSRFTVASWRKRLGVNWPRPKSSAPTGSE